MAREVTERYVQEQLDEGRARRIAEILAEGLLSRLKAQGRSKRRGQTGGAPGPGPHLPTTLSDTAPEEADDGP